MIAEPSQPTCLIIAGPNGAGKTTFSRAFLRRSGEFRHYLNADLIAAGISPLKPEEAAGAAGRILLSEIDRLAAVRAPYSRFMIPLPETH